MCEREREREKEREREREREEGGRGSSLVSAGGVEGSHARCSPPPRMSRWRRCLSRSLSLLFSTLSLSLSLSLSPSLPSPSLSLPSSVSPLPPPPLALYLSSSHQLSGIWGGRARFSPPIRKMSAENHTDKFTYFLTYGPVWLESHASRAGVARGGGRGWCVCRGIVKTVCVCIEGWRCVLACVLASPRRKVVCVSWHCHCGS